MKNSCLKQNGEMGVEEEKIEHRINHEKQDVQDLIKTSTTMCQIISRVDESLMIEIQHKNTLKIMNKHSSNFCNKLVIMLN